MEDLKELNIYSNKRLASFDIPKMYYNVLTKEFRHRITENTLIKI